MDAQPSAPDSPGPRAFPGDAVVFLTPAESVAFLVRGALLMHLHKDGATADLAVLGDGNPALEVTRQAWSMGHGITRARLDVPHFSQAQAGMRWCTRAELATFGKVRSEAEK